MKMGGEGILQTIILYVLYQTAPHLVHAGKRFKVLINSGVALSLAHTSVYNMIEDHSRTKILSAAVHLKTADGSAKSSLDMATLHLCTANFNFSHAFIIYDKLLDTDILFGMDIQKWYPLSCSWDADKQLFIQREGLFLTYTRTCEQQHNIAVVKPPLQIPLRHNAIIPVAIKGHSLKNPVAYFFSNQHVNRRLNLNIHGIDGIYNIKDKSTLHILVANYTGKHVTLNKGQTIGHKELSIDHMQQTVINRLTTQNIMGKHIQPDPFAPPLHTLPGDVSKSLGQLLETFKSQFAQDNTSIGTTHLTKMLIDTGDSEPVSWRPYSIAMKHYIWV